MSGDYRHVPSRSGRGAGQTAGQARPPRPAAVSAERITELLEPVIRSAGMDLESLRVAQAGRRRLLRIVVAADNGPSLDDIAVVSRSLTAELDTSGLLGAEAYTLEVSSPGVDRPLTEPRHWRRARGRLVRAPLADGSGEVQGRLIAADDDGVILETDGGQRSFGYPELGAGQVQVEFGGPAGSAAAADGPADEGEPDGH